MIKCLNHLVLQLVIANNNLSRQFALNFLVGGNGYVKAEVCKLSLIVNSSLPELALFRTPAVPNFCSFVLSAQPRKIELHPPKKSTDLYFSSENLKDERVIEMSIVNMIQYFF